MQLSLDGFACSPNGEMEWMTWEWDDELKAYIDDLTRPVDTIVLGRKTAAQFIAHWAGVAQEPDNPEQGAGIKFTETHKIVFSATHTSLPGTNVRLMSSIDPVTINALKALDGGDLMVYGGVKTVATLLEYGLIDELHLLIDPVLLGKGRSPFAEIGQKIDLEQIESRAFSCGIVLLAYKHKIQAEA